MIKRIYVTKREEVAVEAPRLLREWREQLDLTGLRAVRVWHRYTAKHVDDALWERSLPTIFAEPPLDICTEDEPTGDYVFATELLPGQYDQRADSAMQCLQLLDPTTEGRVAYATVYAVDGTLSEAEKTRLKEYVINPIEAREAQRELPTSLLPDLPQPERVPVLTGFITWDAAELTEKTASYGLAMEPADLACVQEYFRTTERRDPTLTEMRVLDTYWSDHCRHTTFATALREVRIECRICRADSGGVHPLPHLAGAAVCRPTPPGNIDGFGDLRSALPQNAGTPARVGRIGRNQCLHHSYPGGNGTRYGRMAAAVQERNT